MTFLRFDFLSDLGWYGTQWLKGTEVLKKRRLHKNAIYVPDRITEVGIILITTILSANKLKERYGNLISEVRLSHRDELFKGLVAVCGENKAKQVWEFLENNRLEEVLLLRKKLRWYFVTKCFLTNFIGHLIDWFDMARIIGVRLIKPPGMMIAFIGPDGAGKSTLIHALCGELEKSFPDIKKKHLRPRLLPDLGQLKAGNNSKKNGKTEWEIRQEKPGRISSLIRLTYYFLDYIVGYWCKIRPLLAQGKIVIFDRYFYDYIVDPFSKNINLPTVLPKFLLHFVPKPHITIALLNTPEIIYSRKNEIPIDEIARQIRAIETLAPTIPNLYKVKNEGNVFDVAQKVMTIIFGRAPLLPHKIPEK